MKVILPVAGMGTRLRPLTHTTPKALVYVAGKPILGHILDALMPLGVDEIVLVVGYLGDQISQYVEANYPVKVHTVQQPERRGLGHAIYLTAEVFQEDEPVLIVLGDTIFSADLRNVIAQGKSAIGVHEVEDPSRFGIVQLQGGRVERLVEKPTVAPSNLAIVGVYYLLSSRRLFAALQEIIARDIKVKGEYQLTDALQLLIEQGEVMNSFSVPDWLDCGNPETLLASNQLLLDKHHDHGNLVVGEQNIIVPPVSIAPSVKITQSIIGPYVSIADDVEVKQSIIRNSIINRGAIVEHAMLGDSIIGSQATVGGTYAQVNVGDFSDIRVAG